MEKYGMYNYYINQGSSLDSWQMYITVCLTCTRSLSRIFPLPDLCTIGASVEVYPDEDKNFKGLFFHDSQMKQAFEAYPELIFINATYKLLELGLPTYLLLCEDSNGESEIIGVCLLVSEDASSMKWMIDTFKKCNAEWERVHVLMADKDIGERDVLKQCLPNACVLIRLFHTPRSFRREITCEKLGLSSGQRFSSLEFLRKWHTLQQRQNITTYTHNFREMLRNKL